MLLLAISNPLTPGRQLLSLRQRHNCEAERGSLHSVKAVTVLCNGLEFLSWDVRPAPHAKTYDTTHFRSHCIILQCLNLKKKESLNSRKFISLIIHS